MLNLQTKLKYAGILLIILSVLCNIAFITGYINKKPIIVANGQMVPNPIAYVQVKPSFTVTSHEVVRPNINVPSSSVAEVLLARLETATPVISADSIMFVQSKDKQWHISNSVSGNIQLDYMKYGFQMKLTPKVIFDHSENPFPLEVGVLGYMDNQDAKLTYSLLCPVTLPFLNWKVYGGAGVDLVSLSSGFALTDNTFAHFGIGYNYNKSLPTLFLGLGLKI